MFCPQCGQQQMSAEIRFCSRCGMPLNLVAKVVNHGGTLPEIEELLKRPRKLLTRRTGLVFSLLWFLFFVLIMTPFWGILDVDELAGISAVLGIFGGLIIMLSSLFFLKPEPRSSLYQTDLRDEKIEQNKFQPGQTHNALPPPQSFPAADYVNPPVGAWRSTDDLQPSSVTETTTKLLRKEE